MKRIKWGFVFFAWLWIILVTVAISLIVVSTTKAQDAAITVCRDTSYPTLRFEFRYVPLSWFTYDSGVAWGYWADGVTMSEQGVIVADALAQDTDGYAANTAVLLDYDNNLTWVGDANTAPCDVPPHEVQATTCPAQAWNPVKAEYYCYTPLAGGIVPIPEAS